MCERCATVDARDVIGPASMNGALQPETDPLDDLRDRFAERAMHAIILAVPRGRTPEETGAMLANVTGAVGFIAYGMADAMLAARTPPEPQPQDAEDKGDADEPQAAESSTDS
jgi:hypothetical protein